MTTAELTTRPIPAALRERYLANGWWTDDTLGALVERSLTAAPDAGVHIWSEARPWHGRYADLHDEGRRLAGALRAAGIEPGDAVAFQLPNWREAVVAFYGLALGGYVLVPIVHIYGSKEVRFILRQTRARAYISADRFGHVDYLDIVDGAGADLPDLALHLVVGATQPSARGDIRRAGWDAVDDAVPAVAVAPADPDDLCVLAYTSGTTADPKGVMHSHRTLLAELPHIAAWITPGKPLLMGSPVTHATGMLGAVLDAGDAGRGHPPDRPVGPGACAADHARRRCRRGHRRRSVPREPARPSGLHARARGTRPAASVWAVRPFRVALAERAAANGITIVRVYGSTEHPSVTGSAFDDPAGKRHATDGVPLPGVEIRLLDPEGEPVAAGEPGEIWSRGPDLCVGYTDPALTAAAFDDDGWYRTGDLGVLDADGYLTITDRVNDVIIRGGENISAAEVELVLTALDDVAEVAVVAAPDERLGEHACAVVRLAPGVTDLELRDLTDALARTGLARQKWPEELRVVDDFPRTAAGKIRKVDLRRHLRSEQP